MKKISFLITGAAAAFLVAVSCNQGVPTSVKLTKGVDSVSYAIGVNFGAGLKGQLATLPGDPANIDALIAGFVTALRGDTLKIDAANAPQIINQYLMDAQAKEGEKNKAEGDAFLASNRTKDGVITLENGLQYKVLTEGTGEKPTEADQVKVHYTGRLLDGTVFDSSVERGEPTTFGLTQVIRGWTEILKIMPVGSKYQVWIPSELAYGSQGAGQDIKSNSVLEFEIELLEIIKGTSK
ncbi:MAG: FKBP-type peptidyl-prolyl cis-trans isomerase [Tannerella sp.]|jgi:FKBP-type peptidyl-prolyl cis-trans isomerase FkpA/FKBP-type peptidyl-prolyl cis-trans isomerase FklB|nr:FKBP-type peptidyl-prolyl cis-trans isomerase [Tannerella sp.]